MRTQRNRQAGVTCGRKEGRRSQAVGCRLASFLALLPGSLGANHLLCYEFHFSRDKGDDFYPLLKGTLRQMALILVSVQAGSHKDFCSQTGGCSPQPLITQPSFSMHRHLQSITQRTKHYQGIHCGSFLEMCSNYFSLIITLAVLIIMSGFGLSLRASIYGLCFILDRRGFILSGCMFSFQLMASVYPVYVLVQKDLLIHASQRGLGVCCTGSSRVHILTLSF